MLKSSTGRMLLATFGSVAIMAGTATPALAAKFTAVLNGDGHALAGGDTNGWGRVKVNVDNTFNQVCADIEVRSVGRVRSVDIYRGGPGVQGQAVVHLDRPDDGDEDDCDSVGDALADDISRNPGNFYVLVRTEDFPRGAIRGQLVPSSD
jgi:hypothetical protein